jgi:hypothetical protein
MAPYTDTFIEWYLLPLQSRRYISTTLYGITIQKHQSPFTLLRWHQLSSAQIGSTHNTGPGPNPYLGFESVSVIPLASNGDCRDPSRSLYGACSFCVLTVYVFYQNFAYVWVCECVCVCLCVCVYKCKHAMLLTVLQRTISSALWR